MKLVGSLLVSILGLVLFLVAGLPAAVAQGGDDPAQVEAGKAIFEQNCAGCHSTDGTGVQGQGRSLIGVAEEADREQHIESIVNGISIMPAWGERLSDEEIQQVASYVRLTFTEDAADDEAAAEDEAEEEAAAEDTASQDEELASTGVGTTGLALIGVVMMVAGAQLSIWSRRNS